MEEKMGGKKIKEGPTIFYPSKIGRKSGGKVFYQSNEDEITLLSIN